MKFAWLVLMCSSCFFRGPGIFGELILQEKWEILFFLKIAQIVYFVANFLTVF